MPSGAKKRKAAKKKKEQNSHNSTSSNNNTTNPQGNDDPKSQDERDSDGGEVGSPASQDHHNQEHPFNEESEKRDHSSLVSEPKHAEDDAQRSEKSGVEDDGFVQITRELDSEQNHESNDVGVEHVDFAKQSHTGDDKSSGSSCSDDESHSLDQKLKAEAPGAATYKNVEKVFPEETPRGSGFEKPSKEANGNSVVETDPTYDLAAHQVPMSEVAEHVMAGAQPVDSEMLNVIETGFNVNENKLLPKSNDITIGVMSEKNEEKAIPISNENVEVSSIVVTSDVNGNEFKVSGSYGTETTTCAEETKDLETSGATVVENEGKKQASSDARTSETGNTAVRGRDRDSSEYTETETLVPPPLPVAQRTSWMSCCGLCDVFIGSSR